jgi:hypothetical protein
VSPLLAANSIFLIALKAAYTYVYELQISVAFAKRRKFHFKGHLQIGFNLVFTTESVKTPSSLFGLL